MLNDLLSQLKFGLEKGKTIQPLVLKDYRRIVFCGVGGSLMPAEAISMLWLEKMAGYLNRTPYLPHWISEKNLVICTSWSGQTEEILAIYQEAQKKKIPLLALSGGGELAEKAKKDQVPFLNFQINGVAPRNAFGYLLAASLTIISGHDMIEKALHYSLFRPAPSGSLENQAQQLAAQISQKVPLIYSSFPWRFLGYFWKRFFNENSKRHAFPNFVPEALHNEIAPLLTAPAPDRFYPLILLDQDEHPDDIKRLQKFSQFLQNQKIEHQVINLEGQDRLEKILQQYGLARLTSERLAQKVGFAPEDISLIENFKKFSPLPR